jgi:UDP:flavonoid glycosyltransferase YjiC (YdhE family)
MGTLVNGLPSTVWHHSRSGERISGNADGALGRQELQSGRSRRIPSNTIVVRTAPQIDLLKRAALCITHAGLNTALKRWPRECQWWQSRWDLINPVAARIAYHGVGEFIEVGNLTTRRLSDLIARVKENPKYRYKAGWFQKVPAKTRGPDIAADVVEHAFRPL